VQSYNNLFITFALLSLCSLHGIQPQPTGTIPFVIIDSITNNTQKNLALYDEDRKIMDIPAGKQVFPAIQFNLQKDSLTLYRKLFFIIDNLKNTKIQFTIVQRLTKNRTLYGYTIYKKIDDEFVRKKVIRYPSQKLIGQRNNLSIVINDIDNIHLNTAIQMTLTIANGIYQEIEKE